MGRLSGEREQRFNRVVVGRRPAELGREGVKPVARGHDVTIDVPAGISRRAASS